MTETIKPESTAIAQMQQVRVNSRETMRAQLLANAARVKGVLEKRFKEIDDENMRAIPDHLFRKYYVPLFSGEMGQSDDPLKAEKIQELILRWIDIAGSVFSRVAVIDESGMRVAIVPPLQDRNTLPLSVERQERRDLGSVFEKAVNTAASFPNQAYQDVVTELNSRFQSRVQLDTRKELREQWTQLLAQYGKSLTPGDVATKATSAGSAEIDYNDIEF